MLKKFQTPEQTYLLHCGRTNVRDRTGSLVVCHRTTEKKMRRKWVKRDKEGVEKSMKRWCKPCNFNIVAWVFPRTQKKVAWASRRAWSEWPWGMLCLGARHFWQRVRVSNEGGDNTKGWILESFWERPENEKERGDAPFDRWEVTFSYTKYNHEAFDTFSRVACPKSSNFRKGRRFKTKNK